MASADAFRLGGMLLGVATAATQIEGGDVASNWTVWAARPGTITDGSTPARATDHWRRWREDTDLMASLGVQVYRMSVEWARLEPRAGQWDDGAFRRYREELELLRDKGIRPLVTLHHFSHPLWFERNGGWLAPGALWVWERFVSEVVTRLGDLVSEWVTVNEPNVYVTGAYVFGDFPPGHRSLREGLRVYAVFAAAHLRAYTLIHALQPGPDTMVGVAHHVRPFRPGNPANPWHRALTPAMRHLFQGAIVRAMTTGEFVAPLRPPDGIPAQSAGSGPGRYADFFGLNYYSRTTVTRFDDGTPSGVPVNDLGWEVVRGRPGRDGPVGVADLPPAGLGHRERHGRCRRRVPVALPVGAPSGAERPSDARRSGRSVLPLVLRRQLEWNDGEGPRFGLVALDYDTQERAVRDSGRFFAEVIAEGGGTPELYASNVAGQEYPVSRAEGHHR